MNREDELKAVPLHKAEQSKWPAGVRTIGFDEVDGFGIDAGGVLHWHGKPIEIKHPVILSKTQSVLAAGAAVAALVIAALELLKFFGMGAEQLVQCLSK